MSEDRSSSAGGGDKHAGAPLALIVNPQGQAVFGQHRDRRVDQSGHIPGRDGNSICT